VDGNSTTIQRRALPRPGAPVSAAENRSVRGVRAQPSVPQDCRGWTMQDLSGKKGPTAWIVVNFDPWGTSGGLGDDTGAGSIPNPTGGLVVNYDPGGVSGDLGHDTGEGVIRVPIPAGGSVVVNYDPMGTSGDLGHDTGEGVIRIPVPAGGVIVNLLGLGRIGPG
jgi:hypothetical protein